MFKFIKPELATLVDEPPNSKEWIHEVKLDGYRIVALIDKSNVELLSRNNKTYTDKFKNIAAALKKLRLNKTMLDGEVVVLDENNRSDFQLLQNSMGDSNKYQFFYFIFDIISHNGEDLRSVPLIERKEILRKILPPKVENELRYNDYVQGNGKKIFTNVCKLGLEGIVSKRADSHYVSKRTQDWLKIKCHKRQEFVVGGYTDPRKSRSHFGALLLGFYNKKQQLIYCGRVGTGFTQKSLQEVFTKIKKEHTEHMPFVTRPPESKHAHWLKPVLVAEIEYGEMTRDGILRQPSFKGLRSDKSAKKVVLEIPKHLK